ncbi:hypothetical protein ACLOJK_008662 [Asimina triloba]
MLPFRCLLCLWALALNFFLPLESAAALLPREEVEALKQIANELVKTDWDFTVDPCSGGPNWIQPGTTKDSNNTVRCNCTTVSVNRGLKRQNLSGVLPPSLARLPYLKDIDLTRNYLNGTIPSTWATMPSLQTMVLDGNQLSGILPQELGNLTNLERFIIPSNEFTGELPETLGRVLRNCNLSGEIPAYIGGMKQLMTLSLKMLTYELQVYNVLNSFQEPNLYLTSNLLTGSVPQWILTRGANIDPNIYSCKIVYTALHTLAYREIFPTTILHGEALAHLNVPPQKRSERASGCTEKLNGNVYSNGNGQSAVTFLIMHVNSRLQMSVCLSKTEDFYSLHINCGGDRVRINGNTTYEEDKETSGASKFALSSGRNWALSSTGSFIDDKYYDDYIAENETILSMPNSELYTRARLSAITLTYYGLCLLNGNYRVQLHFAEIIFTDGKTFSSLGRRIFDVYIQDKLVLKDFNIKDEAGGSGRAVVKNFNISVTNNTLEIRFYWGGKGTKSLPNMGTYDFAPPKSDKGLSIGAIFGIVMALVLE